MRTSLAILLLAALPTVASETGRVVLVHDGDTFMTGESLQVRLLGIDAPELYQPGGDISRDMLEKWVLGKTVRLESDREDKDDFGRLLRYVYAGDTMVNAEMVRRGYATVRLYQQDLVHKDTLERLELTAARIGKGLWSFNVFTPPSMKLLESRIEDDSSGLPGLEVVSWDKARDYIGRLVTVQGLVVATYRSDKVLMLNFHQDYRNHFKVAIFATDLERFPAAPEDYYKKRLVQVTGLVKDYKGAPEIIVRDPGQIRVLE